MDRPRRRGPLAAALVAVALPLAGCYSVELGTAPYACSVEFPECPDGYTCDGNRCTNQKFAIPKTGNYTGAREDPGLDPSSCPDADLEPNDSTGRAVGIAPDAPLTNLAICPAGDVDFFHATGVGQYVKVTVDYEVKFGDLDVGLVDASGTLKETDGSARDNGCVVSSSALAGDFFIAVVGANNRDVNGYSITMQFSPTRPTCSQ